MVTFILQSFCFLLKSFVKAAEMKAIKWLALLECFDCCALLNQATVIHEVLKNLFFFVFKFLKFQSFWACQTTVWLFKWKSYSCNTSFAIWTKSLHCLKGLFNLSVVTSHLKIWDPWSLGDPGASTATFSNCKQIKFFQVFAFVLVG